MTGTKNKQKWQKWFNIFIRILFSSRFFNSFFVVFFFAFFRQIILVEGVLPDGEF